MLSFDFEAAVLLKQWDSLVPIIDEARGILDDRLISTFVDCILSSGAPVRDMVRVVEVCTVFYIPSNFSMEFQLTDTFTAHNFNINDS